MPLVTVRELDCQIYHIIREAKASIRKFDEEAAERVRHWPSTLDCVIHWIENGGPKAVTAKLWLRSVVK